MIVAIAVLWRMAIELPGLSGWGVAGTLNAMVAVGLLALDILVEGVPA